MNFVKLCQISNDSYIETADREIVLNQISSYPQKFSVEVIDWISEEEFIRRGKINSFNSEGVTIIGYPPNIRDFIFNVLVDKYPNLVK